MTVEEFDTEVLNALLLHPEWRHGQAYFNCLYELRPHLSEQIRGTKLDPFHDDRIIAQTRGWLEVHWDDPVPEGFVKPTPGEIIENAFKKAWG